MIKQHLPKIEITRHPELSFGVSIQSPSNFQFQHSMISNRSYINPFISIDKNSLSKLNSSKSQAILKQSPQWTSRQHLANFSTIHNNNGYLTGRMVDSQVAPGLNHSIQFDKKYQNLNTKQNTKYFHKRKGEFTSYLQNHLLNTDFNGPILGNQRSQQKRSNTKQKILLQKLHQLEKTKSKYATLKPNRSLSPLLEKTQIHRNRLQLNDSIHQKYQEKQNTKIKTQQFQLPKINKNQLENSLIQIKSHYRKYKNQNLTKSFFTSSLSSIKTADLDKSQVLNKSKFI